MAQFSELPADPAYLLYGKAKGGKVKQDKELRRRRCVARQLAEDTRRAGRSEELK